MGILREIPPTAGFPFSAKDFFSSRRKNPCRSIEEDFKSYLGLPFCRIACSGTAAFYLILESLKKFSVKKTVVIPAFICPLLPLAIRRAGLKSALCDINQDNFDFDRRQLEELCRSNPDIVAIAAAHLGGIPLELDYLRGISSRHGILLIEDCAQSLGARYKGGKTGSFGDFSFFSLCRGKGLTIYEGGLIAARKPAFAAAIDETLRRLVRQDPLMETLRILELLGYWFFYRPRLFWYAYRLPQAFWEKIGQPLRAQAENFDSLFPLHTVSSFRKALAHLDFPRLEREIAGQKEKALFYLGGLRDVPGIRIIRAGPECEASYPYLTVIFGGAERRDQALRRLQRAGLGGSLIYGASLPDYPYLEGIAQKKDFPSARYLAGHSLSLSTNTFLNKRDLSTVLALIRA